MVHELDSMLYNNLYVNGVQAASRSSMGQSCSKFGAVVGPAARLALRVIVVIRLGSESAP